MEDSTFYTLQEIEKLQQKISVYRDTLMTLKRGTSLEDYLVMKSEFDVLKMQISHIEGLSETIDEKQHTQSEVYEEQAKQFSFQLAALNQTIEEMNQEILSNSNKLTFSKGEEISENNTVAMQEEIYANKSTSIVTNINDIPPSNNQPSYMQLRNLANQVIQLQKKQENIAPVEHTEYEGNQKQQHHFNQRYFQSINTHPDNIYNGLYKNTAGKVSFNFKNTEENQDISLNDFTNSDHSSHITNEDGKTNISSSIERVIENLNTASLNAIESNSESVTVSTSESNYIEPVMPIEKTKGNAESSDVESKKQKNSLLFNIFRKWN